MTPPTSRQPPPGEPPDPFDPYGKFWFFCGRVLPVLLGGVGVASFARAGFLKAEWLGWAILGLGCFLLMALIRFFVFE